MIKNLTRLQKSFLAIVLAIFMSVSGGFALLLGNLNFQTVHASMPPVQISVANSNFNDSAVTGDIISPSGWTAQNSSVNVTAGIISLDNTIFTNNMENNYELNFRPYNYEQMPDEQILMINSKEEKSNSGFKSPSFVLEKNSYFTISFKALTENNSVDNIYAIGSASLTGNTLLENLSESTLTVNTNGNWMDYNFFVQTDSMSDMTVSLELWLGFKNGARSYGAVFFDDIKIYQISEDTYDRQLADSPAFNSFKSVVNLNTAVISGAVVNGDFETYIEEENTNRTGWKVLSPENLTVDNSQNISGIFPIGEAFSSNETKVDDNPTNANIVGNTKALLINNRVPSSVGYASPAITIARHRTYMISILVKSNITDGTAQIKLVENNPYGDNENFITKTFSNESVDTTYLTNTKLNDWIEYNFYVKGRVYEDTTANLELWLGTDTATATGYVFFDNITVREITTEAYSTGTSSSGHITSADFSASQTALTIPNGAFNYISTTSLSDTYPYAPQNWTLTSDIEASVLNGIINTQDTSDILGIMNPGSVNGYSTNNNVLMIGNKGINAQRYTTGSTFSLSSNSYYQLSLKIQTQSLMGAEAGIRLYNSTMTLCEFYGITSDGVWTTYTLLIKTGSTSESCYLALSLGDKVKGTGYAFFDNVVLTSSDEATYYSNALSNYKRVNLSYEDFSNVSSYPIDDIYTSNSLTATNASSTASVKSGIIDTTTIPLPNLPDMPNPINANAMANSSGHVLMINSTEDCNYFYTTKNSYTLSSGSYYKISVYIKTSGISQNDLDSKVLLPESETEYYPYGATFSITELNQSFTGIDTNGIYKQYIFYVNATENKSVNAIFGLGNVNGKTSGYAFFSEFVVETIEQSAYLTGVAPLEEDDAPDNIIAIGNTTAEQEEEETENDDSGISFNWLVVPTLITSLALLIAIVGYALRKINFKKPVKVGTGVYDREKTLKKEFEHREAIRRQQERLDRLKLQLEDVKVEIVESKKQYKQDIKEYGKQIERDTIKQKSTLSPQQFKEYKSEQKQLFEQQKQVAYLEKQAELKARYDAIEAEIELIYQEELQLIKAYKEYKQQLRIKKRELKESRKHKKTDNK